MADKFSIFGFPSAVLKEASWVPYVTPIFTEGIINQWGKKFGLDPYETLEDTIEKVKSRHNSDKVNLVGHSMGGIESIVYTLNNPEEVDNCVTVASPYAGTNASVLGITSFAVGLYFPSAFQMMPGSDFMKSLGEKVEYTIPQLETFYDVKITNIWSPLDEFVYNHDASLVRMLGRESEIIEEKKLYLGHCSVFYCEETKNILHGIMLNSKYPTIMVHGFSMNKRFFRIFFEDLPKNLEHKTYALSYDYAKELKI